MSKRQLRLQPKQKSTKQIGTTTKITTQAQNHRHHLGTIMASMRPRPTIVEDQNWPVAFLLLGIMLVMMPVLPEDVTMVACTGVPNRAKRCVPELFYCVLVRKFA